MKNFYIYSFFGLQAIALAKAASFSDLSFYKLGMASLIDNVQMSEYVMIVLYLCLITYYIMVSCKKQWVPANFRLGFSMVPPQAEFRPEKEEMPVKTVQRNNVLLIISDKEFGDYLESALSNHFRVSILDDWKKIDREIVGREVDVIVVDEWVEEIDGGKLCTQIREDENMADIPIVLFINSNDSENYIAHTDCGANRLLFKYTDIRKIAADIQMLVNNSSRYRQKICELTVEKFTETFPGVILKDQKDEKFINEVRKSIEKYALSSEYGVKDLADHAKMCSTNFYLRVKEVTGVSPKKLITAYKMKRAEELIRTGEYQITDVALMVGYTDDRYFAKQFKKIYHVCPSRYLESLK